MRKNWDEYFMDIAFKVADRSTCPRLHVGAVLVKNKRIKGTGYNGSPRGLEHCDDVGCFIKNNHCIRTIHAEVNCLLEVSPEDRENSTLYVTHMPCPECQKLIITCGIIRVIYSEDYSPEINWFKKVPEIELICIKRVDNINNGRYD